MKKLFVAALLAVSCSAFAGVPAGYEDAPAPNDKTRVIVNKEKQALISVSILSEQAAPADQVAQGMSQQLKCGEVQGDESKASFDNCEVDGQKMNVLIINEGGKVMMVMANQNATQEDVAEVFAD